ncbi:MAG: HD domain-containing protein [Bacteroidales bacterium]|nr:MAG: HD domain-containing protein [Bacteroidales bacterium]
MAPKFHSLFFEFAIDPGLEKEAQYQYFLSGYDKGWSVWSPYNIKEYTNLKEGRYTFRARTRILNNPVSDEFIFQFKILPPIHRTVYAFTIYIIFSIILLWMIIQLRSYKFAKERFRLERIINERTEELVKEKDKSENLLANVLPKDTAEELKTKGKVAKKKYNMTTVLFSDIQGFTKIAEQMNPETLIDELDKFFFYFDSVAEKYNIEKIKTIGDAYMCAGGIPDKNRTNPVEVVLAALEMQQYMKDLQLQAKSKNQEFWDIRIGIHTGPVIAGVVGSKKLSYDIWGDTVNTASRMESSGEAGKINISGSTYELVRDFFICEYRGKMPVKYKGEIDMYFVTGIRPELSVDLKGLPNQRFKIHLQILRLNDFEETIMNRLAHELDDNLYFHNVKHTMNVATQAELIGRAEGISDEDMLLVRTAALLHDTGYIKTYDNHEEASCDIAREMLQKFKYSDQQIDKICELILTTKSTSKPGNLLEKILNDANRAFFGRVDFIPVLKSLYNELQERNKIVSEQEWYKNQIKTISEHEFFTKTARLLRDVEKEVQLTGIKELIHA